MSNRSIELHDSEIAAIFYWGDDLVLIFSHAYIHQSEGTPGRDPGSGWSQRAELVIEKATDLNLDTRYPWTIYSGSLQLGTETLDNEIPIPLDYKGNVSIKLHISDENSIFTDVEMHGHGAKLTLLGEPRYVEEFPGSV